ncbi:DEAD/DEAH box helicase family protein [Blastococcus sp. BMG 814]|uniref:DEAD/DEAH box helicase family protein n=1 Tax=Blastococcus carthaginiensis TaxID=3050034 RepID=A0ABT9IFM6_9ACTN|nr:DEAD/DEAH box helicase family protein [Blastococcus carthaginiensis]MDP5184388.1 DEAD/DEAH box helicase family protein [Blastococcus carthaginiensis]
MKFTLKDYQADAVAEVLERLDRARTTYERDGEETSFSLTATTGAGKTVMAAAAIESLFFGSDRFEFDADEGAVVIWFSDDPNLNDQTRMRLMQASEKLTSQMLVSVKPPFSKPKLEPGNVYFLNTGKLTKSSLLTRGHVDDPDVIPELRASVQPDLQGWTIWETIANTIQDDDLTVYLVLDEAHRGFNTRANSDKPTIVRRLINGHAGYPPIPVVWGISATIENFDQAMKAADADETRRRLPGVHVDATRVQESGLVKDTIVLDIPAEAGNFDTVLVRRAARRLRESTERWQEYTNRQGIEDKVHPLLVLQTPNTPDPDEVGRALDQIFEEYPELYGNAVRHVLGDHSTQMFGSHEVEWIEPQRVEETTRVRVLVAKDGISTGWDCPRAEVLVSFRRSSKDNPTHITQLLGRMVRNPLARRVPGDERLNAVDCILPFFDRTTAGNVVKYLTGKLDEMPASGVKKVLLDGRQLSVNAAISEAVWKCWDGLPTLTVPQRGVRPVKRLVTLAHALSSDGVRSGALSEVERVMHRIFDDYTAAYRTQVEEAIKEVRQVRGQTIRGKVDADGLSYTDFVERADDRAIRVAFEDAKKAFGADIAISYVNHLTADDSEDDDGLREAYVRTSALAYVAEVRTKVDQEADAFAMAWFDEHRDAVRALPDERVQAYEEIRALATEPQRGELQRPRSRMEDYIELDTNGQQEMAELVNRHLMSDADGQFPLSSLNPWEREVIRRELARPECIAWYRNPSRAAVDSLGITYRDGHGNWRSMHPDFIFFEEVDGQVRPSIVDPHGHHLDDAEMKLRALADFAEHYGDEFHRIWSATKIGSVMQVLNLKIETTREAIRAGGRSPIELYESDVAFVYKPAGTSHS